MLRVAQVPLGGKALDFSGRPGAEYFDYGLAVGIQRDGKEVQRVCKKCEALFD